MAQQHYFAYGSNMSEQVFRDRVVGESVGPAVLFGYRLAFTLPSKRWGGRAADLVVLDGAATWGRLWLVDDEHLESLDRVESNYRRLSVTVGRVDERDGEIRTEDVSASTYVVLDDRRANDEDAPAPQYLQHMLNGAAECGLPEYYTRFLGEPVRTGRRSANEPSTP